MIIRRVARPLLSSIFITGGIDAVRDPQGKASIAEPVVDRVVEAATPTAQKVAAAASSTVDSAADAVDAAVDAAPVDPEVPAAATATDLAEQARSTVHEVAAGKPLPFETATYVRANGAVQVGAGLLLAAGKAPRLASTALAVTLVPTTLAAHRFWELEGEERKAQQVQFAKNLSLLGGLILAAVDTGGQPDLAWRAKHLRAESKIAARAAKANAAVAAHAAKADAKAAKRLAKANAVVAGKGGEVGLEVAGRKARKAAKVARAQAKRAQVVAADVRTDLAPKLLAASDRAQAELAPRLESASGRASDVAADLGPRIQAAGHAFADRAAEVADDLSPRIQAAGHAAADRAAVMAPKVQAAAHRVTAALPTTA
jgi:uncharacterized membrane protein YphA (DoxX/SURF4 family)